jgi:hypothetical protein
MRPLRGNAPGHTWLAIRRELGAVRPALEAVQVVGKRDRADLPTLLEAARVLADIDEPGVLAVRAVAWDEARSELVVAHDWIEGASLAEVLRLRRCIDKRPVSWGVVAQLGAGLAHGLAARHRPRQGRRLVVDALSVDAILVDVAGQPWLTTLGCSDLAAVRGVGGELASVERDVFLLCAMLYECATLEPACAQAYRQERPAAGFSPELWRTILRGLHPDPSQRWSSALALARAIELVTPAPVSRAATLMLRNYVERVGPRAELTTVPPRTASSPLRPRASEDPAPRLSRPSAGRG